MIGDYPSPTELLSLPLVTYEAFREDQRVNWLVWYQRELARLQESYPQGLLADPKLSPKLHYEALASGATKERLAGLLKQQGYHTAEITSKDGKTPMISVTKPLATEPICDLWTQTGKKLWVQGANMLKAKEGASAARIYLAIKPEHAFEAFASLCQAMLQNGSIAKVSGCIFLGGLDSMRPQDNSIVLYVNNTREPGLMNSLLQAINQARSNHSQLFSLSRGEYDYLVACRMASYKMEYNPNTTIVEQPSAPQLESWDSGTCKAIDDFIGFSQYPLTSNLLELAKRRLARLQTALNRQIYDRPSSQLIHAVMTGTAIPEEGEVISLWSQRSMRCPALVEAEEVKRVRQGNSLVPLTKVWQELANR